jgi:hypothetical protein
LNKKILLVILGILLTLASIFVIYLIYNKPVETHQSVCEKYGGIWSEKYNNCRGGSLKPCESFEINGEVILRCDPYESFCKYIGANMSCMSYEQKGHGRDICYEVCQFP